MLQKNRYRSLAVFVIAVLTIAFLIGWLTAPGDWYEELAKPSFNPPNWIFGPVWTGLYLLIAVAGWRLWCRAPASSAMRLWFAQMGLNWLWSPTFFGLQAPTLALIIILILVTTIIVFIVSSRRIDTTSSLLFVPYLAWVAFAALLNAAIVVLN